MQDGAVLEHVKTAAIAARPDDHRSDSAFHMLDTPIFYRVRVKVNTHHTLLERELNALTCHGSTMDRR